MYLKIIVPQKQKVVTVLFFIMLHIYDVPVRSKLQARHGSCLFVSWLVYALLVNPVLGVALPFQNLTLFEPELDFLFGVFDRVTSVADVTSDLDAKISSDGSGVGFQWVGSAQHLSSGGDGLLALPDHADDRSTANQQQEYCGKKKITNQRKSINRQAQNYIYSIIRSDEFAAFSRCRSVLLFLTSSCNLSSWGRKASRQDRSSVFREVPWWVAWSSWRPICIPWFRIG
jgi:hypothetical protein